MEQDITISVVTILMVLVSHMVLLVNISGHLCVDLWLQAFTLMVVKATVPVLKVVIIILYSEFYLKWLFCESGNQDHNGQFKWGYFYSADPLWDSKNCISLEQTCCQGPGLHGFTRPLTLPLMTILRWECVEISLLGMRMSLLVIMKYTLNKRFWLN